MAEEFDLSKGIEQLQEMLSSKDGEEQIQNILSSFMGSGNNASADNSTAEATNSSTASPQGNQQDFLSGLGSIDTIMKIQNVMNAVKNTKDSHAANFLQALKPYLSKERRQKVDQAAKMLAVTKAIKAFKELGGE